MSNSNRFSMIPRINMPRSSFDMSFNHKTTINAGKLYPVCVQEVLPGDSFKIDCSSVVRLASALVSPMMDNLEVKMEWFFVPNRLVWEHWENMMGQQENPDDSIDYLVPAVKFSPVDFFELSGTVFDYFQVPVLPSNDDSSDLVTFINILPLRAYWKIWQDWYRDENLEDSQLKFMENIYSGTSASQLENKAKAQAIFGRGDCSVAFASDYGSSLRNYWFRLAPRAKKHDYFTSALPWPQKGPGVELPIGSSVPLSVNSSGDYVPVVLTSTIDNGSGTSNSSMTGTVGFTPTLTTVAYAGTQLKGSLTSNSKTNTAPVGVSATAIANSLSADLSEATSVTINSLRQAFQLQKYYETLARGGSRYTEIIRSFFGVVSPDARLQRSEYLGGYSFPLMIATVPQNSETSANSPQGNLAAFGMASNFNKAFSRSFTEHGFIIGLASVVSKPQYQQGLHRMYSRRGRLDYYWPTFAHLGEQAILNKEIYLQGTAEDDEVFGYQERFAEYRFNNDVISGQMRSTNSLTLDSYHLAQKFDNLPTLSADFIRENPPIDRVVAVTSQTGADQFICDFYFDIKAVRVMPVYGVPGLVDHF